ncbi:MAG: ATP-binding protein [Deltaproteobacteria bacterium]|nr:ATP-binding protein [Deltaproteobacteria bacterium]
MQAPFGGGFLIPRPLGEVDYCFFDEIQEVPGWEVFIARLLRTERCEVSLAGSSAHMLSTETATQMRGRSLSWELFPFSFTEFLTAKGLAYEEPVSSRKRHQLTKAFEAYWEEGAFPEVVGLDPRLRLKIHQEYFNAMLFRDLVERHDISHPRAVKDLAGRLVDNLASMHSVNKLQGYLKSLGHKVPKASVADYLAWLEDAYVFFAVRIFDPSLARANTNPKKIYCIDHALATSVGSGILVNSGHLLENLVFTALRRSTPEIFYYRSRSGREVDFVVQLADRSRRLVQVCESLVEPRTRAREMQSLEEAMQELDLEAGLVVTRHEEETLDTEAGAIRVLPAWRFLLESC